MSARLKGKPNLSGNMVGEGLVQGGMVVFDKQGDARAVYLEETGREPPMDDILAALKAIQAENASAAAQSTEL